MRMQVVMISLLMEVCGVACETDLAASFQERLEPSTFEVCCGILWHPPLKGVQIDDYAVACALGVASLPYPLVAYVLGMASLLCQVKTLVACVLGVA
jgi:hypothetical protein